MVSIVGWGSASRARRRAARGGAVAHAEQALWGALVAMAFAGGSDAVSAVFRTTILQSAAPDRMRGRLQGVFIVVVAGGPRLGELLGGAVAERIGEGWMAVWGGIACIVAIGGARCGSRAFPALRRPPPHPVAPRLAPRLPDLHPSARRDGGRPPRRSGGRGAPGIRSRHEPRAVRLRRGRPHRGAAARHPYAQARLWVDEAVARAQVEPTCSSRSPCRSRRWTPPACRTCGPC